MIKRTLAIMRKEFIHIIRDTTTLITVLLIPMLMLILYGYALTLDVKHVPTAIFDEDMSKLSRDYVARFSHIDYFDVNYRIKDKKEIVSLMDSGRASLVIWIPRDFSRKILSNQKAVIETIFDGVDSTRALIASSYVSVISESYNIKLVASKLAIMGKSVQFEPIKYVPRFWYNPELRFINFILPGLICIILMMLSALLTSMTIVGEKEAGTIESIVASPVKPLELMLGKIAPYVVIALIDTMLITFAGPLWFKVPIKGSIVLLFLLSFIFLFSALGLGLLISTSVRTKQEAFIVATVVSMLPSILLSGFVFPISSMVKPLQIISYFVPARYFLVIIRGIFMKGIGINYLWPDALFLVVFGLAVVILSGRRFKKRLE